MTIPSLLDLAAETVASAPGTSSTISLSGTAVIGGFLNWSNAGAGNSGVYRIRIVDGQNSELAFATYNSSGNTFTNRTTLIASVGGGATDDSDQCQRQCDRDGVRLCRRYHYAGLDARRRYQQIPQRSA
jgi:hypothetical protein